MAGGLLEHQPVFQQAIERVAALLDPQLQVPLIQLLRPGSGDQEALVTELNQTGTTQPLLFAVGYALAQLWLSWGVEPDLLLGHSVGEVLAAHLAGVLNLEDSLRLVVARGRLMQELPGGGGMLALLAPSEVVESLLLEHPELTVAASNGPANTVVSGPREALDRLQRQAEDRALACQRLAVSHAFHSPAMAPMLAAFERELRQLRFQPPSRPLVSNLTGRLAGPEIAQPDYWCEHVMSPVRFAQGMETLASQGVQTFVEVGSRPTLIGMGRQCLQEPGLAWHPSLRSGQDDVAVILTSLARLHLSGHRVDWKAFHQPFPHRFVELPGYPFQRQRFWWPSLKEGEGEGQAHLWLYQIQPDQDVGAATADPAPPTDNDTANTAAPTTANPRRADLLMFKPVPIAPAPIWDDDFHPDDSMTNHNPSKFHEK
jgi:myxalamid-type polyketide synthase MxaB